MSLTEGIHARLSLGPTAHLVKAGLCLLSLVAGTVALGLEVHRVLATRDAAEAVLREAAVAAVAQLDGTRAGLERAARRASHTAAGLAGIRVEFAPDAFGPWLDNAANASNLRCVRITGNHVVSLPLLFLLVGHNSDSVWASAQAEQLERRSFSSGLFPYAVIAHSESGSFGFEPGKQYALRWPTTLSMETVCSGDRDSSFLEQLAEHPRHKLSFLEVPDSGAIKRAILNNAQTTLRLIGDQATFTSGAPITEAETIGERVAQDTDTLAPDYRTYLRNGKGNGRRMVAVPVRSLAAGQPIVTVGAFFLGPAGAYRAEPSRAFCAEFIGGYMQDSQRAAAAPIGYYTASVIP
ncbi:MAG: hypothetical protein IT168_32860 [Bryobacterales bacterium]|nr:hypothetical protein [Bryobacterales bacterium]